MRYVLYKDNIYLESFDEDCFVTGHKEKTDDTFYRYPDNPACYAKDIKDGDVYDLYQIDFFVEYHGKIRIIDHKRKIENYKVVIYVEETDRRGEVVHVPLTVDLHDCSGLHAYYAYFVRGGKKLDKHETKCVYMGLDKFMAELEKHCHENV